MKHLGALIGVGFLALSTTAAWGQEKAVDVTGVWEITSETPRGTMTRNVTFQQEGNKLTGSIQTRDGSAPIQGTQDGAWRA